VQEYRFRLVDDDGAHALFVLAHDAPLEWQDLDWLVVRDFTEAETASFWYAGHPVQAGDLATEDIKTEVFLAPL